ncbi:MAG: IS5 family transposase [Mariprofundaceae bacterium]|nr:IS5 family transposase [Mariprofundaceae bacterium]
MCNTRLIDDQWDKVWIFLQGQTGIYRISEKSSRDFVDAVLWILRSGAQWKLLPNEQGKWNTIYKRFVRWGKQGVWEAMHACFSNDADMECIMIDGAIIRAHACASGAISHDDDEPEDHALGRSKGGFTTKIHVMVDALGNPLDVILTAGQKSDINQAYILIRNVKSTYALMDKA